jgi:hypothetical protein
MPEGEKFINENSGLINLPPEVWQHETSMVMRKASDLFTNAIRSELQIRQQEVFSKSLALVAAERAAGKTLKEATRNWVIEKRLKTLGFSCLWLSVSFLLVIGVRAVAIKFNAADFNGSAVLGSATVVLSVLYAYQVGQMLGAAVIALALVLAIVTIWSSRRTKSVNFTQKAAPPVASSNAATGLKTTP